MADIKPLTDFEIEAIHHELNLADGHAYQDHAPEFLDILDGLKLLWTECEKTRIPEMESRFRAAFANLAASPTMMQFRFLKICPTASNSIDIIGVALAEKRMRTLLIEPTFDNLALILHRNRVELESLGEHELIAAVNTNQIDALLGGRKFDALFLVQPNNPTGRSLTASALRAIADFCAANNRLLILDNSFRFYNRGSFDDYEILVNSGVSFVSFEDTGKVWPTHDMKASLMFCSPDWEAIVGSVYNEFYLCNSRFTLGLLERYLIRTKEAGLGQTIWKQVDEHRALLRQAIISSPLQIDPMAIESQISVEWLDCRRLGLSDLEFSDALAQVGVFILPGRQFFWNSGEKADHQFNVRLALMKPRIAFGRSIETLGHFARGFNAS